MKQKIDWRIVCLGIGCLTAIEIYALNQDINGIMLSAVIAIIAGTIGYTIPSPLKTK